MFLRHQSVFQSFSLFLAYAGHLSLGDSSTFVGPIFENEARDVINRLRSKLFSWATTTSDVRSRSDFVVESGRSPQFDLFGYSVGDSAGPCVDIAEDGVIVVPPQLARVPPTATIAPPSGSSITASNSSDSPIEKCQQLETALAFLQRRFRDRTDAAEVVDITDIVGAALLVFAAQASGAQTPKRGRAHQLADAVVLVRRCAGPLMQRLINAGRLLVIDLSPQDAPQSAAERANFSFMKKLADALMKQQYALARVVARLEAISILDVPSATAASTHKPTLAEGKSARISRKVQVDLNRRRAKICDVRETTVQH